MKFPKEDISISINDKLMLSFSDPTIFCELAMMHIALKTHNVQADVCHIWHPWQIQAFLCIPEDKVIVFKDSFNV